MKVYKLIDGINGQVLIMTDSNNTEWSVPTDPANSHYAEYLRYTKWVEAGNTPEDFWRQDGDQ